MSHKDTVLPEIRLQYNAGVYSILVLCFINGKLVSAFIMKFGIAVALD